jgi:hypoxanthine phosphoribosyltransferase
MSEIKPKPEPIISVMYSEDEIKARITALAAEISRDYKGQRLHCIGILKGCFIFMADLLRQLDPEVDVTLDFMTISSYGNETKSSGEVKVVMDLDASIRDRHVMIIEDIVDTGLTLNYLLSNLKRRGPKSLKVCTFLNKTATRKIDVPVDYAGFEIPTKFVLGYGMDVAQRLRNKPFLGILENPLDED